MVSLIVLLLVGFNEGEHADSKPKLWKNETELSGVWTGGNSESNSLGVKNAFTYDWGLRGKLDVKLNGVRVQNTNVAREGTPNDDGGHDVNETRERRLKAENYRGRVAYQHKIRESLFWLSRLDWMRNRFAGVNARLSFTGGVGNKWRDTSKLKFSTEYGLDLVREDPVHQSESFDETYAALNLEYKVDARVSPTTRFKQQFSFVTNAENNSDFRSALDNDFRVSINTHLLVKLGVDLAYANEPRLENIPIVVNGTPTGENLLIPVKEMDTTFSSSLVITF